LCFSKKLKNFSFYEIRTKAKVFVINRACVVYLFSNRGGGLSPKTGEAILPVSRYVILISVLFSGVCSARMVPPPSGLPDSGSLPAINIPRLDHAPALEDFLH